MFRLTTDVQQNQLNTLSEQLKDQQLVLEKEIASLEDQVSAAVRSIDFDQAILLKKSIQEKDVSLQEVKQKIEWATNFEDYLQKHKAQQQ